MVTFTRIYARLFCPLALAMSLLCIAVPGAFAATITYTFSGPVSGTLNGAPFSNAQITIVATGDTSNIPNGCFSPVVCNSLSSVTFTLAGFGTATVTDALLIFDNSNIGGGLGAVGLERVSGGGDWIDVDHVQFTTYGLATSIGPLTVAAHTGSPFGAVATTAGVLALTSNPNIFQAVTAGVVPPTIVKSFGAATIPVAGSTSLSFTITNPNVANSLTGVGVTDTLPAGLVVSTPNGLTGSCGGGTITAVAGSGSVSLAGATLPTSASCTFSVSVTGTTAGTKDNTTGPVTSVEGGPGGTASASVTVVAAVVPPTIGKSFGAASIALNGSTSLSFTITNPNPATALTGIGFSDSLPAGLVVSTPNGLTGSCGGGTITAVAGSGSISLASATLAGNASCTFSADVTATAVSTKNNTTGAVTSVEGGTGGTASASLAVTGSGPPPPPPTDIPTLQQWAVWLLGLLILVVSVGALRRRSKD